MTRLILPFLMIFLLLTSIFSQEGYSDYLKVLTETEQALLLPVNQLDFMKMKTDLNKVLSSHYQELYPGARILLFLTDERFEQWKETKSEPEYPLSEDAVYIPSASHFTKPAYASTVTGILGFTGFVSLKLWAENIYNNDYLSYGPGQEDAAADAKQRWQRVDTASYIALGIGSLGLMLTPVLNNYGETRPRRLNDETAVQLTRVSAEEKYNALVSRREQLIREHEQALRRKPKHRAVTLTSLGLTIASGIATGICSYLGREAYEDYSSAVFTTDAEKARKDVELYDMLTISTAAATGVFTLSTIILSNTAPKPKEIEREILSIDYQLENWIGF